MSHLYILILSILLIPFPSFAETGSNSQNKFNLSDIQNLISRGKPASVEAFMDLLPAEFKEQYVLIKDSQSIQKSQTGSDPKPRVLMYGGDGLIISVTGQGIQGGESVEILQQSNGKWTTAEFTPGSPMQKHPQKCVQCHGEPARPLWSGYPCWPTAFGANDDVISDDEKTQLSLFFSQSARKPPYNRLTALEKRYTQSTGNALNRLVASPNSRFTEFIRGLDSPRNLENIRSTSNYSKLKYFELASLLECANTETRLAQLRNYKSGNYTPIPMRVDDLKGYFDPAAWKKIAPITNQILANSSAYEKEVSLGKGQCRDSFWTMDSIGMKAVASSQRASSASLYTGFDPRDPSYRASPDDPIRSLNQALELAKNEPDFADLDLASLNAALAGPAWLEARMKVCTILKKKSAEATKGLMDSPSPVSSTPTCPPFSGESVRNTAVAVTFGRCVKCHTGEDPRGPRIPFDDAAGMKRWLAIPANLRDIRYALGPQSIEGYDRMPLDGDLTPLERDALLQYIDASSK